MCKNVCFYVKFRSFCIFSAAGVVAIYFFQLTFFVACFSIDRRRVETRWGNNNSNNSNNHNYCNSSNNI